MKFFSKQELYSLLVIFLILVGISWPNFSLSLRRARDQVRRDDIGNVETAIDEYYKDYGVYPASTPDGRLIVCKAPGAGAKFDPTGKVNIDLIPCTWGHDTWINLTPGVSKTYLNVIPGDPDSQKGAKYVYFSDGSRYQLFAAMEGTDEPGYDKKLAVRNVSCGIRACNMGRVHNVPMYMSIEEYNLRVYCTTHKNDVKCIGIPTNVDQ